MVADIIIALCVFFGLVVPLAKGFEALCKIVWNVIAFNFERRITYR